LILAADEVVRSLGGTWDLLQRRQIGLRRFNYSDAGLLRSFAALALCAPAFVMLLAGERASAGVLLPGTLLFDDPGLVWIAAFRIASIWLATPLIALAFVRLLGLRGRLGAFLIVGNWSSVLACGFAAAPSFFLALELATPELATFYGFAALALIGHLRWFTMKESLGVSNGVAALMASSSIGLETLATNLLA
jgi:hypothetical protein